MMKDRYFYGNKISEYGVEHNRVDYAALAKSFDCVLNNDIMSKTYEIGYWEQVGGFVDNSDRIERLEKQIDDLEGLITLSSTEEEDRETEEKIDGLNERIKELKEEEEPAEVFQWYIISDSGADVLQSETNEILYYNEELDIYLWGVTHWGTGWDYVLTDIKIDEEEA